MKQDSPETTTNPFRGQTLPAKVRNVVSHDKLKVVYPILWLFLGVTPTKGRGLLGLI